MHELSLSELEAELSAELPTRAMMRHRRRHGGTSAHAAFGSVANANSTHQTISNPQTAVLTGINTGGIGANSNSNTNTQFGTPINFQA